MTQPSGSGSSASDGGALMKLTAKAPASAPPTPTATNKIWRRRATGPPTEPVTEPVTEPPKTDEPTDLRTMDRRIMQAFVDHPAVAPQGPDFLETDTEPEGL